MTYEIRTPWSVGPFREVGAEEVGAYLSNDEGPVIDLSERAGLDDEGDLTAAEIIQLAQVQEAAQKERIADLERQLAEIRSTTRGNRMYDEDYDDEDAEREVARLLLADLEGDPQLSDEEQQEQEEFEREAADLAADGCDRDLVELARPLLTSDDYGVVSAARRVIWRYTADGATTHNRETAEHKLAAIALANDVDMTSIELAADYEQDDAAEAERLADALRDQFGE